MANNFSNSYGIGGNEVRQEGQEAILEIPQNKTLIAQKLTPNTPVRPEIVTGLKNMDEVFEHFDPKINVAFEDDEGKITREELAFKNVGDFSIKGLTAQSAFLTDLKTKNEQYQNCANAECNMLFLICNDCMSSEGPGFCSEKCEKSTARVVQRVRN